MKKNALFMGALLFFSATLSNAQELSDFTHEGAIIFPNGNEKEVIIYGDLKRPDLRLKNITTVDKELFYSGIKIKNKHRIKYKSKDIKGYKIGDVRYEAIKYADMTAIGPASLGAVYFMEVLKEGSINLYKFYEEEIFPQLPQETIYEEVEKNARILIQKGDDKVREVINVNLAEYIDDEHEILAKYENGDYGNLKSKDSDAGVAKFVKTQLNREANELWVLDVVEEYNKKKLN